MLDTFESPQDGKQDAGDTRWWNAMKESDAIAGPTGSEDPEDEIVRGACLTGLAASSTA